MSVVELVQLGEDLHVIPASAFYRVTEREFGTSGLVAVESVGPFAELVKVGPFIMIHDGFIEPGKGIGHHPHRMNERLFYIVKGQLDHDDALNRITGTMYEGDLVRLTEGVRGMWHQEWNGRQDAMTRAFILVYTPDVDPPIPTARFAALREADRPSYEEAPGVETLELIGPRSQFAANNSAIRGFADSTLRRGSEIRLEVGDNEALLLYPLEGEATLAAPGTDEVRLPAESELRREGPDAMALVWSGNEKRAVWLRAGDESTRVLRVVFARGEDDLVVKAGSALARLLAH